SAFGFLYDGDFLTYSRENKTILWDHPSLNAASFWYRRSPRALQHSFAALWAIFEVEFNDPPQFLPGEIIVRLDTEGRLRAMKVIPRSDFVTSLATAPDWPAFFSSAGLEIAKWSPAEPQWDPDVFADQRTAWEGSLPDAPGIPMRIEAASLRGRPVSFMVVYPWMRPLRLTNQRQDIRYWVLILALVTLMAGASIFARQNLRLGRGDRRGAGRFVAWILTLLSITWILDEHHVTGPGEIGILIH